MATSLKRCTDAKSLPRSSSERVKRRNVSADVVLLADNAAVASRAALISHRYFIIAQFTLKPNDLVHLCSEVATPDIIHNVF